jgi:hypothetical protein
MEFYLLDRMWRSSKSRSMVPSMSAEDSGKGLRPAQGLIYCREAQRLLENFGEAVRAVIKLHEQQLLAVVEGDPDAGRFDLLAHDVNERKQNAKYAYLQHLEAHGCSSIR